MRDFLNLSAYGAGHCIGGEPTGDKTSLDRGDNNQCTTCGWTTAAPLRAGLCFD